MNSTIHNIVLDLHASGSQTFIPIIRGDTNRKIIISLVEGGKPYAITEDCVAYFSALKEDGNYIYNDTVISIESNSIVCDITEQTSACVGVVVSQIKLVNKQSGAIISTPTFSLIVENAIYNEQPIIDSSVEFNALTRYVADLEKKLANGDFKGEKGDKGDVGEVSKEELDKAIKGVAKLDRTNPDGIVPSYIVIGSRYGDGTLMDSGVSVDYIMTRLPFQGEHDGEIVYVKAGANENSVLPSGVKIDDVALKEDLVKYPSLIASGTTTEAVEAIEITTDKDGNPFALRNWITIYIEVPAASASSNVEVLLNNAHAAFSLNGITTTKKIIRTSLRWNGRLWESYTVASGEVSNTQVNSIPKYWVNTKNPTKINLVGSFPVGTYFSVYSYRA